VTRTSNGHIDANAYERVVVFFANALGDHVLTLPTARALSAALEGRFTLLTAIGPTDLLFGDLQCQRIVQIPIEPDGAFDTRATTDTLGRTDLFISLNDGHNNCVSGLLGCLAARLSVGFHSSFDVRMVREPEHQVDRIFKVRAAFGDDDRPDAHAHPFRLPSASVQLASDLRAMLDGRRLLVIHAETKPDKSWPVTRVNEAVGVALERNPDYVACALAKNGARLEGLSPRVIPLAGLPLASACAVVAAADVFLGVDSFPLHVADLWRVPGVGLFGPTRASQWGFRFSPIARHVEVDGSMERLDSGRVLAALDEVMALARAHRRPAPIGNAQAPDVTLRYR
jgi:ADP-heptose:LPS heptosyltransferase